MIRALTITFLFASCAAQPRPTTTNEELLGRPPPKLQQDDLSERVALTPADPEPRQRAAVARSADSPLGSERITLDVRDVDVREVLRLLASHANANVVIHDSVQGRVTLTLRDVALDDAFFTVLESQNLGYEIRGSTLMIGPPE